MKHFYTLLFSILTLGLSAQQFSDDFESYQAGDYLGQMSNDWTTWSGATGNAEDVRITSENANSGNNSIFFSSTAANGGPQDVVLPFGGKFETGSFNFSISVYVEEGTGAYWNFQGEENIGEVWSHNVYFLPSGELQFSNAGNALGLGTTYTPNQWMTIDYEINLDSDSWKISIDGECLGSFANPDAAVASLDLFPLSGHRFYVDDISFTYSEESNAPNLDAALSVNDFGAGGLTGMMLPVSGVITNTGMDLINEAEVTLKNGDSDAVSYTLENLGIPAGISTDFTLPDMIELKEGLTDVELTIVSLNGGAADEDPCNSKSRTSLNGVTAAEGKGVLIEEGTGTWCGWCPRGAVFLDALTAKYGHRFVGVAVHNGDPMVVSGYDGQHGFTGYPGATVMRASANTGFGTVGDLEAPFLQYIAEAPKATFDATGSYADRTVEMELTVSANEDLTENMHLGMIIVEDNVRGTDSGYAQSNYYSGGGNGPMGGYESLPSTVPAADMRYDHVARAVPLGFEGESVFNGGLASGETTSLAYSYTVPDEHNAQYTAVVFILINEDGTVDNAHYVSLEEMGASFTSTEDLGISQNDILINPNPTSDVVNIELTSINDNNPYQLIISNMAGQKLISELRTQSGAQTIDVSSFDSGMYIVTVIQDKKILSSTFVKE